jgi:hypothetical protein
MSYSRWTLALDESGRFEAEAGQAEVLVIGGVLCPGEADQLGGAWDKTLRRVLKEEGQDKWPPHATELSWETRGRILTALSRTLTRSGGRWLFVVEPPRARGELRLATYVRMLGDQVDLSARLAVLQGARELDIRLATRTLPLTKEEAEFVGKRGIARLEPQETQGNTAQVQVRSQAEAEVRQALDALSREGCGRLGNWPTVNSVEAATAHFGGAHAGLFFADFACNYLHGLLLGMGGAEIPVSPSPLDPDGNNPPLIVARGPGLWGVRGLDRAFREEVPDVWRAGEELEALVGDARGASTELSPFRAAREGTVRAASLLWEKACVNLGASLKQREAAALGLVLSGRVQGALAAKTGSYEGTWRALVAGWAGEGSLATSVRRALEAQDREVSARLWRQMLECANHRGDVIAGQRAVDSFWKVLGTGLSFSLLAERQQVQNLEQVMQQNRLPVEDGEVEELLAGFESSAQRLLKSAEEDGMLIDLAIRHQQGLSAPRSPDDGMERALLTALGGEVRWEAPDRERGRLYGTAARSLAFCGKLDEALVQAVKARSFFADSSMDLRMNATIVARILLERARLAGRAAACPPGTREALELAGVGELRKPKEAARLIEREAGMRFTLDLVLRALLWAPGAVSADGWSDTLRDCGPKSLFRILSSGELRSHPTELIARHAGELLSGSGAQAEAKVWFSLSVDLCVAAAEESVLRRFVPFTERLANASAAPTQGRLGSILNPSFEYR